MQIWHTGIDFINPLNPPCQGDFGNSGELMNALLLEVVQPTA